MKITITISNFAWANANTRLALRFGIIRSNGYQAALNQSGGPNPAFAPENDPRVQMAPQSGGDGGAGYFSWNSTVWASTWWECSGRAEA
jgi:hypothetical protein